jgi:hypothetical protein
MATNNLDFTSMPFPEDATIAARYDRVISRIGALLRPLSRPCFARIGRECDIHPQHPWILRSGTIQLHLPLWIFAINPPLPDFLSFDETLMCSEKRAFGALPSAIANTILPMLTGYGCPRCFDLPY